MDGSEVCERPGFYAVIPADVRYDDSIPANAKLLYGEISALIGREGFCYATNQYFAKVFRMNEDTITRLITKLEKAGYIHRILDRDTSGKVERRRIYLNVSIPDIQPPDNFAGTSPENNREGTGQKAGYTNPSITDIGKENKKEKAKGKGKSHTALTDEQVKQLCIDWAGANGGDRDEKNGLYFALMGFYAPREKAKQEPARTPTAFNTLTGRLVRFSGGSVPVMIDMLERAITAGWKSVFPLEGDRGAGQLMPSREDEVWL